jgi:N,N-dimethylformamidase
MVTTEAPEFSASLVRLRHGDPNPRGPGVRELAVPSPIDGTYPGRRQELRPGSYGIVTPGLALEDAGGCGLVLWVLPTLLPPRPQVLMNACHDNGGGLALRLDPEGRPVVALGDEAGRVVTVAAPGPLALGAWHRLSVSFDSASCRVTLTVAPAGRSASRATSIEADACAPAAGGAPVTIAARLDDGAPCDCFNGKLESPAVFARALTPDDFEYLDRGAAPWQLAPPPVAAWDFSRAMSGTVIVDVAGGHDGALVNQPGRAVTGRRWSGRHVDFNAAPDEYAAVHFHDDDLEDARWQPSFSLTVPDDLQSGFYAVHLRAGDAADALPFVVRPSQATASADVLVLAPTLTYRAYANEHESWFDPTTGTERRGYEGWASVEDRYAARHRLLSLYDRHSDGSSTCYVSLLRPQVTVRPGVSMPVAAVPHGLGADLYLVDWLDERGTPYDVAADEDLHEDGRALLDPYRVVITGTHPEYWTERMLSELTSYVDDGGRLMYLGGNGFYWVASIAPDRPHLLEVRRGHGGTGPFRSAAGETHHSTTGEPGGLWRFRGRTPQALTGVGFAAMGHVGARPYTRAASVDRRARFVFEGVPDDTTIGDSALALGAAAGLEVDRLDHALGTPADAMLLASAVGVGSDYTPAGEDVTTAGDFDAQALVRADIVYLENDSGGAVFSVGSIAWCSALSADGYESHVSRITANVLDRFAGRPTRHPLETAEDVR